MDLVRPADLDEALAARAARPDALALRGGTDVMVELNLDQRAPGCAARPRARPRARGLERGRRAACGSERRSRTARSSGELASSCPRWRGGAGDGLGADPQPRHRGGQRRHGVAQRRRPVRAGRGRGRGRARLGAGSRRVPAGGLRDRPEETARCPDELIRAVHVAHAPPARRPTPRSPARNAMVMGTVALGLCLDATPRSVAVAAGGAAPTPVRAPAAEAFAAAALDWAGRGPFGAPRRRPIASPRWCFAATDPQDDVRGTAALPAPRARRDRRAAASPGHGGSTGAPRPAPSTACGARRTSRGRGESLLRVLRDGLGLAGTQERLRAGRVRLLLDLISTAALVCACLGPGRARPKDPRS